MNTPEIIAKSAGCFCGAVKLQFSANTKGVINCHCGECRRLSGSAFTTWTAFAAEATAIEGKESLTAFQVTENVRRYFCRTCGSHVYTSDKRYSKMLGVPAGAFSSGVPFKPSAHYFVGHRAAWNEINDAIPQFGGESGHVPTDA
jgi:hypothetical protein